MTPPSLAISDPGRRQFTPRRSAIRDPIGTMLAAALGVEPAQGRVLLALYLAKAPLHKERLMVQARITGVSLHVHISKIRRTDFVGLIACKNRCYTLSPQGKETVSAILSEASDFITTNAIPAQESLAA